MLISNEPEVSLFLLLNERYSNFSIKQNGYKMRLMSVDNCGDDNVVTIDANFTANLSPDCILSTIGCLHSKGFKEAKVRLVRI